MLSFFLVPTKYNESWVYVGDFLKLKKLAVLVWPFTWENFVRNHDNKFGMRIGLGVFQGLCGQFMKFDVFFAKYELKLFLFLGDIIWVNP